MNRPVAVEVIHPACTFNVLVPHIVVERGIGILAVCPNAHVAARLAELWDRHGIADVPDTPECLT